MAQQQPNSDPGYARALKRIVACHQSGEKFLGLSYLSLNTLPPEIGQLTALTKLDVQNNRLEALPESVSQLPSLQQLQVRGNPLPEELLRLSGGGIR